MSARLRERIIALQRGLDRAAAALTSQATPKRIHTVRVAARRLDALLHAFHCQLDSRSVKRYRRSLKALIRDLEAAREADVSRRAIAHLTKEGGVHVRTEGDALREQSTNEYLWALQRLRSQVADAPWQRRLSSLQRLSKRESLVPVNDESAAGTIIRRVNHARRGLRRAMRHAGKNANRLHRLRLKVKRVRYLLEDIGAKAPLSSAETELKGLQRLQDCLGDMHDEENLRDSLRVRRMPRRATHIIEELKRRKLAHFKVFNKCRKAMTKRWRHLK